MYKHLPNPVEFLHPKLKQAKKALGFKYLTLKEWWAADSFKRIEILEIQFLAILDELITDTEKRFLINVLRNYYIDNQVQHCLSGHRCYRSNINSILEICAKSLSSESKDTRIHGYHHLFQLRGIMERKRQNLEWLLDDANKWLRSNCTEYFYLPKTPKSLCELLISSTKKSNGITLDLKDLFSQCVFTESQRKQLRTVKALDRELDSESKSAILRYIDLVERELISNPHLYEFDAFKKRVGRVTKRIKGGLRSNSIFFRFKAYRSLYGSVSGNSDSLEFLVDLANSLIQEKLFFLQEQNKNVVYANA